VIRDKSSEATDFMNTEMQKRALAVREAHIALRDRRRRLMLLSLKQFISRFTPERRGKFSPERAVSWNV
jgi:hypothetical protein